MHDFDVVILTESRYENPTATDWYIGNLLHEDNLLREALQSLGLRTTRVDWARDDFDWSQTRAAVFRSTWDYFHRFAEFASWLERVANQTRLINAAELVRWNCDKHYLLDLQRHGITVVPTHCFESGEPRSLVECFNSLQCKEAVLKPAISGAGRHTYRVNAANIAEHESIFHQLVATESMLLQPFQQSVLELGELALIVLGGVYSHTVRKVGKPGDFRVHDDYGGTVHSHRAAADEIALAERAVAVCTPTPTYARVDLVRDNTGQWAVMELELVEPELFFRFQPQAAERLAELISGLL